MATKKVNTVDLLKTLSSLDKGYFTTADLEKITGLSRDSLKVAIYRMAAKGVLLKIKRGVYQSAFNPVDVAKIANQLYYPSYLSFESALSLHGILSQIPYTQTFATTKRSKKMILWKTEVEYRQLRPELFFGYQLANGVYLAEPEKALLDELYLVSRGKAKLNIEELDLTKIDKKKFGDYAKRFPVYIKPPLL